MANKDPKDPKDPKSPEVSVASMVLSDMAAKGEISGHKKKMSFFSGDPYGTSLKKGEETLEKSMLNVLNGPANQIERLAFEVNPYASTEFSGLYRRKSRLLPDYLLKRISIQDNLVASILLARSNQMSAFGRPQPSRDTTGFRIEVSPSHASNLSEEQKKALRDRIAEVESIFLTCGETAKEKDSRVPSLSEFMFVQARNAITFGRVATEVIYDYSAKGRRFHSFKAIDAGTIYMANKLSDSQVRLEAAKRIKKLRRERAGIGISPEAVQNNEYSWYQVIDDTPMIAFRDDECLVHNFYPCTDVELAGYPVTPIDTVISAITTHLNIVAHNKLYFQSGRAARGMLVIQSDDIDEESIANIKQHFNANINSVTNAWRVPVFKVDREDSVSWQTIDMSGRDMEFQYLSDSNAREILSAFQMSPEEIPGYAHLCLHPDTKIWTQKGAIGIGELLNGEREVGGFSVWTGSGWSEARAFATGLRNVAKTTTSNGITLTTSPEHRFRVVSESGELGWKQQKELALGDTVLVNRQPIPGYEKNIPSYADKKLTVEMAEVLGWLTGDGSINVSKKGKVKHSKGLEFYYHHEKEVQILERHAAFLSAFGLNPKIKERRLSVAQVEKQKRVCGFKSVSDVRRSIALYDTNFVEWLLELGFVPSNCHKKIPAFIHGLPVEYRQAFLRGFFSADGSKDKMNTPSIAIAAEDTREETKLLLLNLGIRTRACEGTSRTIFLKREDGTFGHAREKTPSKLIVKDKHEFYERIGFLQAHKQPDWDALNKSSRRWDKISKRVSEALCDAMLRSDAIVGHEARDAVRHALKEGPTPYRERSNVSRIAAEYGFSLPEWTNEFFQESVVGLESSDETEEMVDIEVFDDTHAFMANGVVVHNSRGTNSQSLSESNSEYQLEAHRDLGIRPLLGQMQNFINSRLFPIIAPDLAKIASFKFLGLDAETPEKESIRLQQDLAVHMTMDEVLERVEKDPVGLEYGGNFLLNPQWQAQLDKYVFVGEIMEHFFQKKGAAQDPRFQYMRDPFFFQWQQLAMQQQQMQQAQQQQEQMAAQQAQQPQGNELEAAAQNAHQGLEKNESQMSLKQRALIKQQEKIVQHALDNFKKESEEAVGDILSSVAQHFDTE